MTNPEYVAFITPSDDDRPAIVEVMNADLDTVVGPFECEPRDDDAADVLGVADRILTAHAIHRSEEWAVTPFDHHAAPVTLGYTEGTTRITYVVQYTDSDGNTTEARTFRNPADAFLYRAAFRADPSMHVIRRIETRLTPTGGVK